MSRGSERYRCKFHDRIALGGFAKNAFGLLLDIPPRPAFAVGPRIRMLLRSAYRRVSQQPCTKPSYLRLLVGVRTKTDTSKAATAVVAAKSSSSPPKGIPYTALTIGIPKEIYALEKRVAATPESVERLLSKQFKAVHIETGAGNASCFTDAAYQKVGATIVTDAWQNSDIILKVKKSRFHGCCFSYCVFWCCCCLLPPPWYHGIRLLGIYLTCWPLPPQLRPPTPEEAIKLGSKTLISFIYPKQNESLVQQFQTQKSTVLAMDGIPRTLSRGQTYDALSSQANISGYRAVLEASNEFGRFFAGQMTAAGKVPPAKGTFLVGYLSMRWKYTERKMCVPHQSLSRALVVLLFIWLSNQFWSLARVWRGWPPFKRPRAWVLLSGRLTSDQSPKNKSKPWVDTSSVLIIKKMVVQRVDMPRKCPRRGTKRPARCSRNNVPTSILSLPRLSFRVGKHQL
jgi:Alanine dehydrogenase/PNT, N-terminal domain